MKTNCNRRDFLKGVTLTTVGLVTMAAFGANAEEKKKKKSDTAAAEAPADPTKGKAKEFKYADNHSKVTDASIKVEKMGVAFDKQNCKNCALFQSKGNGTGVCTLMMPDPNHIVKETGWCTSWAKNPNVTI